jgi:hypothetical protein
MAHPTPLRQLDGMALSCTTSAPFVLAPTSGVRFRNSFTKRSDEVLVSPKGQISQKIPVWASCINITAGDPGVDEKNIVEFLARGLTCPAPS